eukprot:15272460-Alexandrium_andersonii.AAC.1
MKLLVQASSLTPGPMRPASANVAPKCPLRSECPSVVPSGTSPRPVSALGQPAVGCNGGSGADGSTAAS